MKLVIIAASGVMTILTSVTAVLGGVNVALVPSSAQVTPGGDFHVFLRVVETGSLFNSYEAVVSFDPTDVTFVQEPLALQEGDCMRDACGNTFNAFVPGPSALSIEHALLCSGTSITGPGDLYVLHFQAGSTPGTTTVGFVSVGFYDSGFSVPLLSTADAVVQIGSAVDNSIDHSGSVAPRLVVVPNPFAVQARLRIVSPAAGAQTVRIYDARGTMVRELDATLAAPVERVLCWDGRDARGAPSPAGVYWIVLGLDSRQISRRVTLVR